MDNTSANSEDMVTQSERVQHDVLIIVPTITSHRQLSHDEAWLLESYVQQFSQTYPTFVGPANPFMSILLPYAMQNKLVLDALLVLSCAQLSDHHWYRLQCTYFSVRQRALAATQTLLHTISSSQQSAVMTTKNSSPDDLNILALLANAIMFLLHDKIAGEVTWTSHFDMIAHLCQHFSWQVLSLWPEASTVFEFLHHLYLYNDLVRATSLRTRTTSRFYVNVVHSTVGSRYYFPSLIARLCEHDETVSETDFATWDGNMSWMPSMSMANKGSRSPDVESSLLVDIYRNAGLAFYHQNLIGSVPSTFASQTVYLANAIPAGSSLETALLWPLSLAARGLSYGQMCEKTILLDRLLQLGATTKLRHVWALRKSLAEEWNMSQEAEQSKTDGRILFG